MDNHYDVIVVGLGGIGSAAAHHLAGRGLRVLGLEQFGPVHDRGASRGETRGVWQAYFMGPRYVPFLQRAYTLWDELSELTGEEMFTRTGGVCLGPVDGELVPSAKASADACGLTHEVLSPDEVHERFPAFTPRAGFTAIYDPSSGFVRPEQTVRAHLDLAQRAGVTALFGQQVREISSGADGVRVRTDTETYHADKVVMASGAWVPQLLPELALPIEVVRKVMVWFDPTDAIQRYQPGSFPYWIWEDGGQIGYGHPAADGVSGGVKAGIHNGGTPASPDTVDRLVHESDVAAVRDFLAPNIPGLAGRYLRAAVCFYDNTPDSAFIIGNAPGDDRIVLATGTSGHAFKFVPAIGEALADLVVDGKARQDISLFDPSRF